MFCIAALLRVCVCVCACVTGQIFHRNVSVIHRQRSADSYVIAPLLHVPELIELFKSHYITNLMIW